MFGKKRLKKNNDILFERNTELNKMCIMLQNNLKVKNAEIEELKQTNKKLGDEIMLADAVLSDKKKEIKKLKTLLTKNKIEYRKEN